MPVLFAGNEIVDMDKSTSCWDQTASATFDALFVKSSIYASVDEGFFSVEHKLLNQPDVWFHFLGARSGGAGFYTNQNCVEIYDDNNKLIFRMTRTSSTSDSYNTYLVGASTITNSTQIVLGSTPQFDFRFELSSTNITVTIYVNKLFHSTMTVVKGTSVAAKSIKILPRKFRYNSANFGISEIIISTNMTVDQRVAHLAVASQGFHDDMEGNVLNLKDPDTATGLLSELAGQRHSWVPEAYAGPADDVAAIVGRAIANRVGGNPSQLAQFLRIGGADYDGAEEVVGTQTYHQQIWSRNPVSNLPWTTADLALLQVGLKTGT